MCTQVGLLHDALSTPGNKTMDSLCMYYEYPLSRLLKVIPEDLSDLLLSAFRQLWQSSLYRLSRRRLLRLDVPEKHTGISLLL